MEKIWHRLGREFAAIGHEVTHVSRRWPGLPDDETVAGVHHVRLPGTNHTRSLPLNLLLDLRWSLRVARRLPAADAVICNAVALPVFLPRFRPDAGAVCVSLGRMPKGQTRFYGKVAWLMAPSEAVADRVRHENPALSHRVSLLPNPIDWALHAGSANRSESPVPLTIGYVGRVHPEKGLEQLLDAAKLLATRADLPAWRLLLVGPTAVPQGGGGPAYLATLQERYGKALGERLGFLPPEFDPNRLAQHYRAMDVFCYPSLALEGEGLSVAPLEAMAAGAVPVLSRLACYDDVVAHGENGFRFNHSAPGDAVATELAGLLAALLTDSPQRRRLAAAAQQTARRFDYAEIARSVLSRFGQLKHPRE